MNHGNPPEERELLEKNPLDMIDGVTSFEEADKLRTQVLEAMAKFKGQDKKFCGIPSFCWYSGF
jgi:hypothetical protein